MPWPSQLQLHTHFFNWVAEESKRAFFRTTGRLLHGGDLHVAPSGGRKCPGRFNTSTQVLKAGAICFAFLCFSCF